MEVMTEEHRVLGLCFHAANGGVKARERNFILEHVGDTEFPLTHCKWREKEWERDLIHIFSIILYSILEFSDMPLMVSSDGLLN